MLHCDFNKVIITGVPVDVPVLNKTAKGVSVFNMTIRSEGPNKSTYFDVTVWGELAEKVIGEISTSSRILVEGAMNNCVSKNDGSSTTSGGIEITANRIFSLEEGRGGE